MLGLTSSLVLAGMVPQHFPACFGVGRRLCTLALQRCQKSSPRRPLVLLRYRSGRLQTTLRIPEVAEMEMAMAPSKTVVTEESLTRRTPGL